MYECDAINKIKFYWKKVEMDNYPSLLETVNCELFSETSCK